MRTGRVILGVGHGARFSHDSGAALLVDGALVAACEEERFTRRKHEWNFPEQSIRFCLASAGIANSDVHFVALAAHPLAGWRQRLDYLREERLLRSLRWKLPWVLSITTSPLRAYWKLRRMFRNARIVFVEHHLAHAASAFFCSGFAEASILSIDGRGEWSTTLLGVGKDRGIEKIKEGFYPHSLGIFYLALTEYLGFKFSDEYKVMGLSSYGKPEFAEVIAEALRFDRRTLLHMAPGWYVNPLSCQGLSGNRFGPEFVRNFGPALRPGEPPGDKHANLARSVQERVEEIGILLADSLLKTTGIRNLVLSGGVCLNGLMNQRIVEALSLGEREVFIQPAADDSGLSLGAALFVDHQVLGSPRGFVMEHAFWGPEFTDIEISQAIDAHVICSQRIENPAQTGARLLADNRIIGWFQGRAEFGPRALGNRSILADPRDASNKDRVNSCVKFRESFRPFAPSVLAPSAPGLFERLEHSPFMLRICKVRPKATETIPAVVHVDETSRPQTLTAQDNPLFFELIEAFNGLTGVPAVLNTSFNVKGEPIVNNPNDAIECFKRSQLDALILGNYLITRK